MRERLSLSSTVSSFVLALALICAGAGVAAAVPNGPDFSDGHPHFSDDDSHGYNDHGPPFPLPFEEGWDRLQTQQSFDGPKNQIYNPNSENHDSDNHVPDGNTVNQINSNNQTVPEPATVLLLGSGLMGLFYVRRRFAEG